MSDNTAVNVAIAASIERGVLSQTELLSSLSVAVIGALLAFWLHTQLHNATQSSRNVRFLLFPWFWLSIGMAALTIFFGYIVSGRLVSAAPIYFAHDYTEGVTFGSQEFAKEFTPSLKSLQITQFVLFMLSIAFAVTCMLRSVQTDGTRPEPDTVQDSHKEDTTHE